MRVKDLKPKMETLVRIARIGIPSSIEQSTMALGFTFMMIIVASFGTYTLAAFGIGNRISSIMFMPAMGFAMAITIMIGQNIGANKIERAERIGWIGAGSIFVLLTIGGALCFLFAKTLVSIFITQEDYAVIEIGSRFIRIIALGLGCMAVLRVLNGAFRGAGDTVTAMALSILALWGIRLPLAAILSSRLGSDGIWWSVLLGNLIGAIAATIWFKRGKWKEKSISERGWQTATSTPEITADSPDEGSRSNL